MNGDKDILERFAPLFPPPSDAYEGLLQLRDRKRRNRRIGAISLASIITLVLLVSLLTASIGSRQQPANPEPTIDPSTVAPFQMSWMGKTAGDPASAIGLAGLTATGNSLYVVSSDDARLSAFPLDCAAQGGRCRPAWTASIPVKMGACHPVECIGSTPAGPAVADGLIFVGSLHHLTAFPVDCPAEACKPIWTAHTNAIAHQAVVADGVVYVGTGDGYLYAFPVACQRRCEPLWVSQRQRTSLVVSQVQDGVIYASTDPVWGSAVTDPDHKAVYAFPTRCGDGCEPVWTAPLPGNDDIVVPLAVSGDTIYVVGSEEQKPMLSAYRVTCGMAPECRSWSATLPGLAEHPLVAQGEVVITVPSAGEVLAFPTVCSNTCEPLWSAPVPGIVGRATVGDGLVFVGSTEGVAAIPLLCGSHAAVCQPTWISDRPAEALAVLDATLLARSPNGAVRAFARTVAAETSDTGARGSVRAYLGLLVLLVIVGGILARRSRRMKIDVP